MMDAATDLRPAKAETFLAGLQAGMIGALWMLFWMGLIAGWQRRSFWTPENLMAGVFHPQRGIRVDFGAPTLSGLALYLTLYSLLGSGFALLCGGRRMRPPRLTLLSLVFALAWYYASFHLIWRSAAPAMLLNASGSTLIGHVIYGIALGRFPTHFPSQYRPVAEIVAEPESKIIAP